MEIPQATESWLNHGAHVLFDTEIPGYWQPAFYPTHPGKYADAQAQPCWEDDGASPGAYLAAVAFYEYHAPINGACLLGEGGYAPESLRFTYGKGFDESTGQPTTSAVVSHDSNQANLLQLAGCFRVHPY
ncbi:tetratricopeptide repeat domain containing protein [Colletotrichum tofieldiae]|nr:tetratricopeptide repeat domain containing protein [Colletotrichum tofieldiae]GKT81386.1 tetratricopeptide repeat domain containing protein [Colletotrichum tofieldiae]